MKIPTFFLKFILLCLMATSHYTYAEASQYVSVLIKNELDDNITLEKRLMWDRVGSLPAGVIYADNENRFHSKGLALRGTGGIYVHKIEDDLYLDMVFDQYHYGYFEYQVCLSNKARTNFHSDKTSIANYNKNNPTGKLDCKSDSSNSSSYQDKKVEYGDIVVKIHVVPKKVGVFKAYNAKEVTVTVDYGKCKGRQAFQSATFSQTQRVNSKDAVYALYDDCLYYSYCPQNSNLCQFKNENNDFEGTFYPIKSDSDITNLFSRKNSIIHQNRLLSYDKKAMDRGFSQKKVNSNLFKIGKKISATQLKQLMDDTDRDYCNYIAAKDKNKVCHNPTYAMQPRIANQLKYLDKKYLDKYVCYIHTTTYPNIGSNICELAPNFTIVNGKIESRQ
ncbi:hypothetical protein [Providencia manganoxydans]|uniref:hypothetical protein n=1 Tax=Providencia manganoxydans TaxID=2923283 RepID=UPI0034DD1C3A